MYNSKEWILKEEGKAAHSILACLTDVAARSDIVTKSTMLTRLCHGISLVNRNTCLIV